MSLMRKHQLAARVVPVGNDAPGERIGAGAVVLGSMPAAPRGLLGGSQLGTFLSASLSEDLAALSSIASVERKIDLKRDTLIPKYRDYAARLMADGQRHELLGYYLVWCLDAGCMEEGLRVAAWAMEQGLPLPERFRASVPLFVASAVVAWAERQHDAGHDFEPYLSQAQALVDPGGEVPDKVRAGFHRLFGLRAEQGGDLPTAERELQRALELGAKVKTALDGVRKRLARDGGQPAPGTEESNDPASDAAPEEPAGGDGAG